MNKVLLTGTVGQYGNEVKAYFGKDGKRNLIANFQLCVKSGYGQNATFGYFNVTKFNVSDKFVLETGKHISVVGSLKQNIWKDKEGKMHYDTVIIADEIEFLPDFPKKENVIIKQNTVPNQNNVYYRR